MISGLPAVSESETFGQRLRIVRKTAGLTLRQVAESVGVDYTYLSKLENDRTPPPSMRTIERLAETCGVLPEHLAMFSHHVPQSLKVRAVEHVTRRHRQSGALLRVRGRGRGISERAAMSDYTAYDRIYKFPIDLSRVGSDNLMLMYLPKSTRLLYATAQAEQVVVYGIVNLNQQQMESRRLWVHGTGHPLRDMPVDAQPLGVCSLHGGGLMFHVFASPLVGEQGEET